MRDGGMGGNLVGQTRSWMIGYILVGWMSLMLDEQMDKILDGWMTRPT